MALVVFLRGINMGGHRSFRPSALAEKLRAYDVVSLGAAGTFVVRKPGMPAKFLAELRRALPLAAEIAYCYGSELMHLEKKNPFGSAPAEAGLVQFVSILSRGRCTASLPISLPARGEWFVQILGATNRLVFGVYRRHMKTIRYLSEVDKIAGAPVTTRSWTTIVSVLRVLNEAPDRRARRSSSNA